MGIINVLFRNGTFAELAKVTREGVSKCDRFKRYKVEWNDTDSSSQPLLMISEFDPEVRIWTTIVAAHYERTIQLLSVVFCQTAGVKFPLITGITSFLSGIHVLLKNLRLQWCCQRVKLSLQSCRSFKLLYSQRYTERFDGIKTCFLVNNVFLQLGRADVQHIIVYRVHV